MKSETVTFYSERGDEFPANIDYEIDARGVIHGTAAPVRLVHTYGKLLKHCYTFHLKNGSAYTISFCENPKYSFRGLEPSGKI